MSVSWQSFTLVFLIPVMFPSGDVLEWFLRFEICSRANKWSKETMSLRLLTLLEGEAFAVWVELSEDVQENYDATKQYLLTRLKPVEFVSLDKFHRRVLQPEESPTMYLYLLWTLWIKLCLKWMIRLDRRCCCTNLLPDCQYQ